MLGAIAGDVVGSVYEFDNHRSKNFLLFTDKCFFTDDTVMTVAVADAILHCQGNYKDLTGMVATMMHKYGAKYPGRGYGGNFLGWLRSSNPQPYNSCGNGSAMRVSPVMWAAQDLKTCIEMARATAMCTHNHPQGVKGAEATAVAGYMALHGCTKDQIKRAMERYYDLNFTLDKIRPTYGFYEICQKSVPQAIVAFLESDSMVDCIRNAISIGGDSDTIAAIAGGIAEGYYGMSSALRKNAAHYLDAGLSEVVYKFEDKFGYKVVE